jgi:class 3 adenylate cyclase/tetratricopeptide (TPR) repeat protein
MKCPRCAVDNREGRRFCAECGAPLPALCPSCSFANEPGEKFCGGCGQPLAAPAAASPVAPAPTVSVAPAAVQPVAAPAPPVVPSAPPVPVAAAAPAAPAAAPASPAPDTYTPRHLAERILTSKSAVEGERKQVTVLFADLKGSMELLGERDPEEARRILDPVLERMMEAVHRYEGTVNQVMGDGIMALFGAPLALESHAVHGCYAALAMQEALQDYAEEVRRTHGVNVAIRVGLNSGEVVVRSIGSDLRMDYSAVGQTTNLAARMEQTAAPGTILLTPETRRLAEGYVTVKSLGPVTVKGIAQPMEVFELTGTELSRTRLQVSAARGLSRFVGRHAELGVLPQALERAAASRGQVVALVGEAGLGKSRLLWEFTHSPHTAGWRVLESRSVSYGKATTYLPVIELLKTYFGVEDRDDPAAIRESVTAQLLALDRSLERVTAPLLALLHVPAKEPSWDALDPVRRRQRTLEAIKLLLLRQSQKEPLVLVFEDLHWLDSESQAVLDTLVESLAKARILLLVNYRPEYRHGWGGRDYYTQIQIRPLAADSAEELLDALLGTGTWLKPLKERLIERTGGNPFFLEESVRTLVETAVLTGEPGAYVLAKPLTAIQMPATVQAILAARIDRLPSEEKRLLQSASVVGKDVPLALLRPIAEVQEDDLQRGLDHLQAGEFIYEMSLFPEIEYTFKHALTHEVAYASLLHERRRALHTSMVGVIEQLYHDRIEQHVERLALHAFRGEQWLKAVSYGRDAGAKALARSAHPEAVVSFEQALEALGHLPESREVVEQSVDLRFNLRNSLWPLGELTRLIKHLREAEALARSLGDERRLGQLTAYMSQFFAWMGEHDKAVESGCQTQTIAERLEDFSLQVNANFRLGQAYYAQGEYRPGLIVLRANLQALTGERASQRLGQTGLPSVLSRSWFVWCCSELGEFDEARLRAKEGMAIAEAGAHPFDLVVAGFGLGVVALRQGDVDQAITVLERALELCTVGHVPFWFPLIGVWLGSAYAQSGRVAEALPLLKQAVDQHAAIGLVGVHSLFLTLQGEAMLIAGQADESRRVAEEALTLARTCRERGHEAWALHLLADIQAQHEPTDVATAEPRYREAIALATELHMRPLVARCQLDLGRLYRHAGRPEASAMLAAARKLLEELEMQRWAKEA